MPRFKTHFDTLGIVPASDGLQINTAYRDEVLKLLPEDSVYKGAMYFHPLILRMKELTAAFEVLCHSVRRDEYIKKLNSACLICPLCGGSGKVGSLLKSIPCVACSGTGWGD